MESQERRVLIEQVIRGYFDACNEGNGQKIRSFFHPDAVHYFPDGAFPPMRGPDAIAEGWKGCVAEWNSSWTIDRMVLDPEANEAVIEWTHWKPNLAAYLRGDEWYRFDDEGLITEIRAYYACPTHPGTKEHELGGYDYAGRGYPLSPPPATRDPD